MVMSTKEKHLYYLTELKDYKVNSKDPDIRGWKVKDLDNRIIGKVDNLLVNLDRGKVMYVDVEVDQSIIDTRHDPYSVNPGTQLKEFINKEGENHIIIPIGLVDLNLDNKYVYTESIDYQTFAETKRYRSGTHISRDYERHVLGSYDRRKVYEDKDPDEDLPAAEKSDEELKARERYTDPSRDIRDTETEDRIRREKENLRYNSEDRSSASMNKNDRNSNSKDLNPERTLDEDEDWELDSPEIRNEGSSNLRSGRRNYDDDFYDRREFKDRDYR